MREHLKQTWYNIARRVLLPPKIIKTPPFSQFVSEERFKSGSVSVYNYPHLEAIRIPDTSFYFLRQIDIEETRYHNMAWADRRPTQKKRMETLVKDENGQDRKLFTLDEAVVVLREWERGMTARKRTNELSSWLLDWRVLPNLDRMLGRNNFLLRPAPT